MERLRLRFAGQQPRRRVAGARRAVKRGVGRAHGLGLTSDRIRRHNLAALATRGTDAPGLLQRRRRRRRRRQRLEPRGREQVQVLARQRPPGTQRDGAARGLQAGRVVWQACGLHRQTSVAVPRGLTHVWICRRSLAVSRNGLMAIFTLAGSPPCPSASRPPGKLFCGFHAQMSQARCPPPERHSSNHLDTPSASIILGPHMP